MKLPPRYGHRLPAPKVPSVLQRCSDGKFLEVWGWGIEWADAPSGACPKCTATNLGKTRRDDFHKDLYLRFSRRTAKQVGMLCRLVPFATT